MTRTVPEALSFGGDWTMQKLAILDDYLDAFTTALKRQEFRLMYIDAFAGTGTIEIRHRSVFGGPEREFLKGSARRALEVKDRPFDRYIFIERNRRRCEALSRLEQDYPGHSIEIHKADANDFLQHHSFPKFGSRGVLFLDPFSTQVEWRTIRRIAQLQMFDTWILFPVSAIARLLPRAKDPESVSPAWKARLTRIYGDESWRGLYEAQGTLFGGDKVKRQSGVDGLVAIYKDNLRTAFGGRFLEQSALLKNSQGSPLFEFMFCAGNPKGTTIAKRIACHLLRFGEGE